jgi:DNA-binding XRE family transcriptional regulator
MDEHGRQSHQSRILVDLGRLHRRDLVPAQALAHNLKAARERGITEDPVALPREGVRYSSQIRAARALLGWSQARVARAAGVGLATLQRIEQKEGVVKGNFCTVLKIQKVFEQAGIHFTDGESGEIGVRLQIGN